VRVADEAEGPQERGADAPADDVPAGATGSAFEALAAPFRPHPTQEV
jgi:hypothetical protein